MRRLRIAVTGREGQVARSLLTVAPDMDVEVVAVGRPEFDLLSPSSIWPALEAARPDCIVSAAAYTAVDKAEGDRDQAFAVNAEGAGAVAEAAARLGVPILHLSTDYVFDGTRIGRYFETDPTGPTSVYGASKLAGERRVAAATANHAIFRTAWVYSPYGANFLRTMLRLGESRSEISVVGDQHGCPTSAVDIARAMVTAARRLAADPDPPLRGIFHLTGAGEASWADFATEIFRQAERYGRAPVRVIPISSDHYPSPVKRPANSRLSGEKLKTVYGIELPDWQVSTAAVVAALLASDEIENRTSGASA